MGGSIGILNVGAGDTKLVFDKDNPADCIRAARIVKDMLRRGYSLLVEAEPGSGKYQRALDFRDDRFEYVIADLDPDQARTADEERAHEQAAAAEDGAGSAEAKPRRGRPRTRNLSATTTKAVAVPHRAGG